ncbi:MAG: thiamine pyrophosphate-dependent dehydrogenase E1 component subunit alpha, partial [Chloroflexota bacterium]
VVELPHGSQGQEAIAVGACYGLRPQDQVLPSLRTRGAFLVKGIPVRVQMAGIFGKVTGAARGKSTAHHMADPRCGVLLGTGLIGSDIPVAVGAALAFKLQHKDNVVVDFFGDGAAQRGDFHEALNFAAVFRLPVVFVLENNGFAEYTPLSKHFAGEDFACRAQGYGMPGLGLDGNDVLAVYEAVQQAVARARAGQGPTLLECITYRYRNHCENQVPEYNRDPSEMARWREKDPVRRLEAHLAERGLLDDDGKEQVMAEVRAEVEDALRYAEESPFPDPSEVEDGVYAGEDPLLGARRQS